MALRWLWLYWQLLCLAMGNLFCNLTYEYGHFMMFNTLRPRQNRRRFTDDIFKCIFLNENVWISLNISLKYIPKVPFNNILTLVQIMAWRRPGDKPLSEPMMVNLLTHIWVTRPQWGKRYFDGAIWNYTCNPVWCRNINTLEYIDFVEIQWWCMMTIHSQ